MRGGRKEKKRKKKKGEVISPKGKREDIRKEKVEVKEKEWRDLTI